VIVRCYNEEAHIGRLLEGILEQTLSDVEIVVVDSGSTDATIAIAEHYPAKIVSIDPSEFTFGRALNIGCTEAAGEYLVFASAHVYPIHDDWLERLIEPFKDEKVALCYGRQLGGSSTSFSEHQVFAQWFPPVSAARQRTPFCNNANAAIRRTLWEEHPYDEELTGLEDLAWAHALRRRGYVISYVAEAEVVHLHDESWRQVMNRYRREAMALQHIFPEESLSLPRTISLWIGNLLSDYYHAVRERRLLANALSIPVFRTMQFVGSYRGFRDGDVTTDLRRTFYYPRARSEPTTDKGSLNRRRIDYARLGHHADWTSDG